MRSIRPLHTLLLAALALGLVGCGGKDSYEKLSADTVEFNEKLLDLLEGVADGAIDGDGAAKQLDELEEIKADLGRRLEALPTPSVEETKAMLLEVTGSLKRMPKVLSKAMSSGNLTESFKKRISELSHK